MTLPVDLSQYTTASATDVMADFNNLDGRLEAYELFQEVPDGVVPGSWSYTAGRILDLSGDVVEVAGGSVSLTNSATNYVRIDHTGAVSVSTSYDATQKPIRTLICDSGGAYTATGHDLDTRINFDFTAFSGIANASDTVIGIAKLSIAPADPSQPTALGANDAAVTNARTPTGSAGGQLAGTYPNPTVNWAANGATDMVAGAMSAADKTKLDNATSSPTASMLAIRDANGRMQVIDPAAAQDVASKAYVDAQTVAGAPDASTTVKGIVTLATAPASPTAPIAVGDNDPRVTPFGASGSSHAAGIVPDPGATAGSSRYLREDGGWNAPPGVGDVLAANNGSDFADIPTVRTNLAVPGLALLTTIGDMIYASATSVWARLAGNTTTTKKFLTSTGDGSDATAPAWGTIAAGDLPDTAVTPDSYTYTALTVDQQGRITAASNGTAPVNPTGDGIPHVVAGVTPPAASLIVNADVDPDAAIDVLKLDQPGLADAVLDLSAAALVDTADIQSAAVGDGIGLSFVAGRLRTLLPGNMTFYVATTGSDLTGDGSSGNPWLTIQYAHDYVVNAFDLGAYTLTIQVEDGTYTLGTVLQQYVSSGGGIIVIQGNLTTPDNVIISTSTTDPFVLNGNSCVYLIQGMKFTTSGSMRHALYVNSTGVIRYSNIDFGTGFGAQIEVTGIGIARCMGNCTISGSATSHVEIQQGGLWKCNSTATITVTGTPAFTQFANVIDGQLLVASVLSFSGSATGKLFSITQNGNASVSPTLPGNAAGTTSSGGKYNGASYPVTTALSYSNSWADVGSGNSTGAWTLDDSGWVHLKGYITSGTAAGICTLGAGAIPSEIRHFPCTVDPPAAGTPIFGEIEIDASGNVSITTLAFVGGYTGAVSLDGISYRP